jgi:hypothetical protein
MGGGVKLYQPIREGAVFSSGSWTEGGIILYQPIREGAVFSRRHSDGRRCKIMPANQRRSCI